MSAQNITSWIGIGLVGLPLYGYFATPGRDHETTSSRAFPNLTGREHEILSLIAGGYTNTAIASRLYLSPKTVRNYVSSIFTNCLLYTSPSPRDRTRSRMPSSA